MEQEEKKSPKLYKKLLEPIYLIVMFYILYAFSWVYIDLFSFAPGTGIFGAIWYITRELLYYQTFFSLPILFFLFIGIRREVENVWIKRLLSGLAGFTVAGTLILIGLLAVSSIYSFGGDPNSVRWGWLLAQVFHVGYSGLLIPLSVVLSVVYSVLFIRNSKGAKLIDTDISTVEKKLSDDTDGTDFELYEGNEEKQQRKS